MQKYFSKSNILFGVLIILVFFIPLYPKFPLLSVKGTYVAIRLEDVLIAVSLAIWFFANIKNLKALLTKNITKSIVLFWLIGLLSLLSALTVTFSVTPSLGFLNWLRRVEGMSLFFLAYTSITNKKQLKIFLYSLLVVAILVVVYGFGQVYAGLPVISTNNKEFSKGLILTLTNGARPNSTFAGHYDLAIYLSMMLVLMGSMFFFYKKLAAKAVIIFSGLISTGLLGLTAARTSFAGALLGLTAVFWIVGKKILIVFLILASVVVVAGVPSLRHRLVATITVNLLNGGGPKYQAPPSTPIPSGIGNMSEATTSAQTVPESSSSAGLPIGIAQGEPINTTELDVSRSVDIRTNVEWPRALHAFYKNPLLGSGYSSLTIATDNDFLRSFGEVGILGTTALALVIWLLFKESFKLSKTDDQFIRLFEIGVWVMVLVFLINGLFIDAFESSKVAYLFWMITGAALSLKNWKRD